MNSRIDYRKVSPGALKAMLGLEDCVRASGLPENLLHLLKLRVSQLNGCAYCIDLHSKELRNSGESEQRIYMLDAWREAPIYTERERAALAWAEAVTLVSDEHVPDPIYDLARSQFSEEDLVNLSLAIVAINGWNRLAIAFRITPKPQAEPHEVPARVAL